MDFLEGLLNQAVRGAILLFEYVGVGIIIVSGLQGVINYLRKSVRTRLLLAQGLAMGVGI